MGVVVANGMFGQPLLALSTRIRSGPAQWLSEVVATFGLVALIGACERSRAPTAYPVAGYIMAAYWFTPSTSFANPAVTLARAFSDTFTGIRPADLLGFVVAQCAGAALAMAALGSLRPRVDHSNQAAIEGEGLER